MFDLPTWSPPYRNGESLPQSFNAPPTVRVGIEASDEWFAAAGDSAMHAAEALIHANLADIQQLVQAHRGYFGLSNDGFQRKHATLPGLALMHDVHNGLETLTLTAQPESAAIGGPAAAMGLLRQLQQPCLLVFYGGNKLAAYLMSALPELKLVGKKTLKKSSWGAKPLLTSQFKFNRGTRSTVLSPLVVKKGVVAAGDKHSLTMCDSQLPQAALEQFVETSTPATMLPLQNGSGTTLYTTSDVYAWGNGAWTKSGPGGDASTSPVSVSSEGTYYYVPFNDTGFTTVYPDTFYGLWDPWGRGFWPRAPYGLPSEANTRIVDGVDDGSITGYYVLTATENGGAASTMCVSGMDTTLHATQNLGVPVYSNDGHVDTLHTNDVSAAFVLNDDLDAFVNTLDCLGVVGTVTRSPEGEYSGSGKGIGLSWFPPSLGSVASKSYCTIGESLAPHPVTVCTPYGQSTLPVSTWPCIGPWLHVSNGKHCVQGFQIWSVPQGAPTDPWNSDGTLLETHLYCDKVDISKALIVPVDQVQTLLMDVPLSRIRQLV